MNKDLKEKDYYLHIKKILNTTHIYKDGFQPLGESNPAVKDRFDENIGLVVALMDYLGYSRRVKKLVSDILLNENKKGGIKGIKILK